MAKHLPSPEMLRKLVEYHPKTGYFFWKERRVTSRFVQSWNKKYAGQRAFITDNGNGYLLGRVDGKHMYAHRAAWAISYGAWPTDQIDHINGEKTDNRIDNLREVTNAENSRNSKKYANNRTGATGVHWRKNKSKWTADIRVNYKVIHLGTFDTFEEAKRAREAANAKYGFHENHGR